jgi:Cof subfamily protein (haloacid dehalogenase superfamily)
MKDYKILFLDMDGTILRPDHTIEESTKNAIKEIKRQGIEVVFATGRPLHDIMETADELQIDSFVTHNGAYAKYKDQEIVKEYINEEIVRGFLEIAKANNHDIIFYTSSHNCPTSLETSKVKEFLKVFDLKKNRLFTPSIMGEILSMTVITNGENEIAHYPNHDEIFLSQVNVDGMRHCYDIILKNINKGAAVKNMLEFLNIPKELSIAFGDGLNDKEMISSVGEGFVMGNGHPDLFAYGNHSTTSVNDSGVYNGLNALGLL